VHPQNFVRVTEPTRSAGTRDIGVAESHFAHCAVIEARASREAEILVLRQQLLVLNRKSSVRRRLPNIDRLILAGKKVSSDTSLTRMHCLACGGAAQPD
jgi:hypothetical protein